ncbi:MAG: alpha/beta hydrolase [Gammaproteobacteria bacterium]|nr:alpha/beta hydrolase [Gammaproteobacteria bacterium]|tara:strand:+ start:239 stop:946 length:708 start_codon:yes stop_codon:yes gene_type:complete
MAWSADTEFDGFEERGFELEVEGRFVPGVYWTPRSGADRLIMLGHGGTTHKKTGYILTVAHLLLQKGFAAMAIDGPGHGDRDTTGISNGEEAEFERAWDQGGGTKASTSDWIASLDFVESEYGNRPTGWWGLSMGTMMGIPVVAKEDRICAALLGLMGFWGPNKSDLERLAPEITCPVRFLVQWDDEVVPIDSCLKLFEKLGTQKKTLHGNPGLHAKVPKFEISGSIDYLNRHVR